jgi:cytochrome bd-type quinol oxidase subunit 2
MTHPIRWPCRAATIFAVITGVLLVFAGWGHLNAVLETRAGQAFDYRFVSLLTTSGILMFPGIVSIATSYWLWQGRTWAYVSCLLSASALMLYLVLLVYMKTQVPNDATAAGDEVYAATGVAITYLAVMVSVLLWLQGGRKRELSAT